MSNGPTFDGSLLFETSLGAFALDLYPSISPKGCRHVVELVRIGYYNGDLFSSVYRNRFAYFGRSFDPALEKKQIKPEPPLFMHTTGEFGFEIESTSPVEALSFGSVFLRRSSYDHKIQTSRFVLALCYEKLMLKMLSQKCGDLVGVVHDGMEVLNRINQSITSNQGSPLRKIKIRRVHLLVVPKICREPVFLPKITRDCIETRLNNHQEYQNNLHTIDSGNEEELMNRTIDNQSTQSEIENQEYILKLLHRTSTSKNGEKIKRITGDNNHVLFVCRLNPLTTEEGVTHFFRQFGVLKNCYLPRDQKTKQSLQYAFVEFQTLESCREAYRNAHGSLLDDRRIRVDFCHSPSAQTQK